MFNQNQPMFIYYLFLSTDPYWYSHWIYKSKNIIPDIEKIIRHAFNIKKQTLLHLVCKQTIHAFNIVNKMYALMIHYKNNNTIVKI
jgi:hypothetical protein